MAGRKVVNMKAIITIDKNMAVLEGLDNEGDYTITFNPADLTPEQRAELVTCAMGDSGAYRINSQFLSNGNNGYGLRLPPVAKASVDIMRGLLDARVKAKADFKLMAMAEEENKEFDRKRSVLSWAEKPPEKRIYLDRYNANSRVDLLYADRAIKYAPEAYEEARALCFWLNLEDEIRRMREEKAKLAKVAEKVAAKQRRRDQIAAWVADNGTPNQQSRLKAGLLPEKEILGAMREEAFAPLAGLERYDKIRVQEFCECGGEHDSDSKFEVWDAETATAKEFDRIEEIKKLMPNATVTLRVHYGSCEICGYDKKRSGIMVRVKIGEIEFSREYAA
jgi:hypothetical protein